MLITVATKTAEALQDEFLLRPRGDFEVKGFGNLALFALEGELDPWSFSGTARTRNRPCESCRSRLELGS